MALTLGTSVCHINFFRNRVDSRDDFKNDFKKSGTDIGEKSIYGSNREITQNVGTKSVFTLKKIHTETH